MSVVRTFSEVLRKLGVDTRRVVVTTDLQEFSRVYKKVLEMDGVQRPEELVRLYTDGVGHCREFVVIMPDGSSYVWLSPEADEFSVYHAAGHVYVQQVVGINVRCIVRYNVVPQTPSCVERTHVLSTTFGGLVQNIFNDVLADLVLKNRVPGYWESAVREASAVENRMLNLCSLFLDTSLVSYMLHILEAVYFGRATSSERHAIDRYCRNPTRETAVQLLNEFVSVSRHFDIEVFGRLDAERGVYWVELPLLLVCFQDLVGG